MDLCFCVSAFEGYKIIVCLWQISLADLQSTVSELETRLEGQTANTESLTSTLNTKEEIITVSIIILPYTTNPNFVVH